MVRNHRLLHAIKHYSGRYDFLLLVAPDIVQTHTVDMFSLQLFPPAVDDTGNGDSAVLKLCDSVGIDPTAGRHMFITLTCDYIRRVEIAHQPNRATQPLACDTGTENLPLLQKTVFAIIDTLFTLIQLVQVQSPFFRRKK